MRRSFASPHNTAVGAAIVYVFRCIKSSGCKTYQTSPAPYDSCPSSQSALLAKTFSATLLNMRRQSIMKLICICDSLEAPVQLDIRVLI